MQIKKFKLINDGYDGIKVSYAEAIKVDKAATIDSIDRTRSIPISIALKAKIAGLTYFFLNLTRHWASPFNKYFNLTTYDLKPTDTTAEMSGGEHALRALWNDTTITGASINNGDIVVTGKINTHGDRVMGLATPTICAEDDFGFYEELKTRLDEIGDDIITLINTKELALGEQLMFSFQKIEGGEEMTADDLAEKMLEKLSDKGAVIMHEDTPAAIGDGKKKQSLKESKAPIDKQNIPEAKAAETKEKPADKKTDPVGDTLASESDFPDMDKDNPEQLGSKLPHQPGEDGNISQYEHSENMGSESEPEPDEEPWGE